VAIVFGWRYDIRDGHIERTGTGGTDRPISSDGWLYLQNYPWLERYRNDPEVALAISQYEKEKARIADELREMVKRPEWQR
jgi:hypothetical protein